MGILGDVQSQWVVLVRWDINQQGHPWRPAWANGHALVFPTRARARASADRMVRESHALGHVGIAYRVSKCLQVLLPSGADNLQGAPSERIIARDTLVRLES